MSFKRPCNKAATSESPRRTAEDVESLSDARTQLWGLFKLLRSAEVVKWQTRTFEGRVAQAVRVQVPPSAPKSMFSFLLIEQARRVWRGNDPSTSTLYP